jgi:hypothetical protein
VQPQGRHGSGRRDATLLAILEREEHELEAFPS